MEKTFCSNPMREKIICSNPHGEDDEEDGEEDSAHVEEEDTEEETEEWRCPEIFGSFKTIPRKHCVCRAMSLFAK